MKRTVALLVAAALVFCIAFPVFAADKEDLKAEIVKQEQISREGADTFWTGAVIGAASAAVLIPVSCLFEDKSGKEMKIIYIVGAGMAVPTLICMIWGGTQWLLAEGGLDNLKKKQETLTLVPYLAPLAQSRVDIGMGVNIRL